MFNNENHYFRVKYKKLETNCRLSNGIRADIKFNLDKDNGYVFALYPEFETLSEQTKVGGEWEALDEGTAIIHKPIYENKDGYYELIRERVAVGVIAYFVAGAHRIAELEIVEIINEL